MREFLRRLLDRRLHLAFNILGPFLLLLSSIQLAGAHYRWSNWRIILMFSLGYPVAIVMVYLVIRRIARSGSFGRRTLHFAIAFALGGTHLLASNFVSV